MSTFIALPAFNDNYIWLLLAEDGERVAVVDPGDAKPVINWLGKHPEYRLSDILITHHHPDHVGGVAALKAGTGCRVWGPAAETIPARDRALNDGDAVKLFGLTLQVIAVPGHTLGHIAYYCENAGDPWLLSGDTLFAGGCGRLFEGTPEQMHASLSKLAALPAETRVYCAHEYTQANLQFAHAVEPENNDIKVRLEVVQELRAAGRMTLPSDLALERRTNPFLRADCDAVAHAASVQTGKALSPGVETFAAVRAWKDSF
ncbi:hydroxyacylglutathione hydrolase [Halopseudomonas sabulinigri]|uniref:Hydroxyacylglutathione hydrolase n=1 Tax=Halopseudomonas sabulinigri TaxID=472181 RepID=A0A1H1P6B3_9GAMM|nr:hydroxyacylglutathione hydrolase [Halopseudomonas sabulinigri]SDS06786.1 hydroxyacylglutathione hydrolase [Halopseudomonas sabulinigri]